jgi:hypothetical protein
MTLDSINAYPVLSQVFIDGATEAVVIAVTIRPAFGGALAVHYECEWWEGRDVKTHCFDGARVRPVEEFRTFKIGFNPRGIDG